MPSLRQLTEEAGLNRRALHDDTGSIPLARLAGHGFFADHSALQGAAVLLRTRSQRTAALALLELDGLAARIVLCTPDLSASQVEAAVRIAGASAIVTDDADDPALAPLGLKLYVPAPEPIRAEAALPQIETGWALFTSGTSGTPKLAEHTLATLTAAIDRRQPKRPDRVWATFYDIRRYGGLQILLRALLGGGSMVLSGADEPTAFLERAAQCGVSFLSGTPTHWRRALLSPAAEAVALTDVRLSGEAADQAILDKLRAVYPAAQICHAFASTEAGVAFEVRDGLAGFPADWLDHDGTVALRVAEGTLRIRSLGQALHYLGDAGAIAGADGFVDTRDLVVARGARLHFAGRSDGVINVGGLKVNPIEVEEVVNQHPRVSQARVGARRSPIIGQVIVAEVVPSDPEAGTAGLEADILAFCRSWLAAHKVPAMVRFVAAIEVNAAGKVVRTVA